LYANLTDVSIGGCFVETSNILSPGTNLMLSFSMEDGTLTAEGVVARIDPGVGVAVQFKETNREGREKMLKILEYVQRTTTFYNNRYFEGLLKR
jgi:C4-type Zn-finger protein